MTACCKSKRQCISSREGREEKGEDVDAYTEEEIDDEDVDDKVRNNPTRFLLGDQDKVVYTRDSTITTCACKNDCRVPTDEILQVLTDEGCECEDKVNVTVTSCGEVAVSEFASGKPEDFTSLISENLQADNLPSRENLPQVQTSPIVTSGATSTPQLTVPYSSISATPVKSTSVPATTEHVSCEKTCDNISTSQKTPHCHVSGNISNLVLQNITESTLERSGNRDKAHIGYFRNKNTKNNLLTDYRSGISKSRERSSHDRASCESSLQDSNIPLPSRDIVAPGSDQPPAENILDTENSTLDGASGKNICTGTPVAQRHGSSPDHLTIVSNFKSSDKHVSRRNSWPLWRYSHSFVKRYCKHGSCLVRSSGYCFLPREKFYGDNLDVLSSCDSTSCSCDKKSCSKHKIKLQLEEKQLSGETNNICNYRNIAQLKSGKESDVINSSSVHLTSSVHYTPDRSSSEADIYEKYNLSKEDHQIIQTSTPYCWNASPQHHRYPTSSASSRRASTAANSEGDSHLLLTALDDHFQGDLNERFVTPRADKNSNNQVRQDSIYPSHFTSKCDGDSASKCEHPRTSSTQYSSQEGGSVSCPSHQKNSTSAIDKSFVDCSTAELEDNKLSRIDNSHNLLPQENTLNSNIQFSNSWKNKDSESNKCLKQSSSTLDTGLLLEVSSQAQEIRYYPQKNGCTSVVDTIRSPLDSSDEGQGCGTTLAANRSKCENQQYRILSDSIEIIDDDNILSNHDNHDYNNTENVGKSYTELESHFRYHECRNETNRKENREDKTSNFLNTRFGQLELDPQLTNIEDTDYEQETNCVNQNLLANNERDSKTIIKDQIFNKHSHLSRIHRKDLIQKEKTADECVEYTHNTLRDNYALASASCNDSNDRFHLDEQNVLLSRQENVDNSSSNCLQTSSSTSSSPLKTATDGVVNKPRVSFISELRRFSRERVAFLRVDQASSHHSKPAQSPAQLLEKQTDPESGKSGRSVLSGGRKKLRVEFAVMEQDSEKCASDRSSGFGGGSFGGGFLSVKDEVENDVSLLGEGRARFLQPRVSLLGKPISYRAHRRDVSYRRLQARMYNFLERPKSWQSWIYHLTVFLFVLLCLTFGVLSSITEFENILMYYAVYLEVVMFLWIMVELGLRVWSAGCRSRYQGQTGRLRFIRRPLCIIDMILSMASISTLILGSTQEHFPQAVLSGLRFFQILRMVRMDRKGGTWKLLGSVVWAHRQELVTTLYIGLLGLTFSSYFVYLAEKDEPRHDSGPKQQFNNSGYKPKFSNFADAIWWGVVTLCTVGYGDVVPATWGGKVIASFSAILGISFFALPAGILGSGFALKVQQQQRQKHLNRRRVPAANLIQCLWRCYAADELSMSTATWKPHLIPCPSPTSERTFKNNTSFVSRFSTRRRDRGNNLGSFNNREGNGGLQSPMTARHHCRRSAISTSEEEVTNATDRSHLSLATAESKFQLDSFPFRKESSVTSIGKESEEEDLSPRFTQLTDQHKRAIRVIRKIRYFVSRRQFREALRPYDVKDVIEQYSVGHMDMLGRIKNLQGRLDQILGRQGSKSKDLYESKICLASRIVKVERQVEDIESKLDMLVDMYKEDRKLFLQQLNPSLRGAIQGPTSHPPPPPAPSSQFKPRPILIDKQFTSEPATPTGIGFVRSPRGRPQGMKPVMQRNLSDLSQRIKKRVTYRVLSMQDPPSRAQSTTNFSSTFPLSGFSMLSHMTKTTSPDELSSTTMSEKTRDESSENTISLSDISSSLTVDMPTTNEDSKPGTLTSYRTGSSDSAGSHLSSEGDYFFSNASFYPCLKDIPQLQVPPSPANSPLILVKTLSTLNEQQSMESDTSQSCAGSNPPTPPTNRTADSSRSITPPVSAPQSPLIKSGANFSCDVKHSPKRVTSNSKRSRRPILRLPSALTLPTSSVQNFTAIGQPLDSSSLQPVTPPLSSPSNHINSTNSFILQTDDTYKLCNMEDDLSEAENGGVTNCFYSTSDL